MNGKTQLTGFLLLAFVFIASYSSPSKNTCVHKYGGNCTKYEDCPGKVIIKTENACGKNETHFICCAPALRIKRESSISDKKCAEYADKVYVYEEDITGFGGYDKVDHCATTGQVLISGGENAEAREFPFMALIGFTKDKFISWLCGGSLISSKFILSAAHCSFHRELGLAKWALLGDLNVSSTEDDAEPQLLKIKRRINHPNYNSNTKYHDISLYELSTEATINTYVRPLCLHKSDKFTPNQKAIILGWGATETEMQNAHLQKATINLTTEGTCKSKYVSTVGLPSGIEWDKMLCAGGGLQDTCQGDSGGPIVVNSDHYCTFSVIGVTSFGLDCRKGIPGVYTRVSNYIKWIEGEVWPDGT